MQYPNKPGKSHRHGTPLGSKNELLMINCISNKTLEKLREELSTFLKTRMGHRNSSEASKIVGNSSSGTLKK
jgi:hypothetical protein